MLDHWPADHVVGRLTAALYRPCVIRYFDQPAIPLPARCRDQKNVSRIRATGSKTSPDFGVLEACGRNKDQKRTPGSRKGGAKSPMGVLVLSGVGPGGR